MKQIYHFGILSTVREVLVTIVAIQKTSQLAADQSTNATMQYRRASRGPPIRDVNN
jgi:hypothetical protein